MCSTRSLCTDRNEKCDLYVIAWNSIASSANEAVLLTKPHVSVENLLVRVGGKYIVRVHTTFLLEAKACPCSILWNVEHPPVAVA